MRPAAAPEAYIDNSLESRRPMKMPTKIESDTAKTQTPNLHSMAVSTTITRFIGVCFAAMESNVC